MFQLDNVRRAPSLNKKPMLGGRHLYGGLYNPTERKFIALAGLAGLGDLSGGFFSSGFGKILGNLGTGIVQTVTAGMYNPSQNRFYVPFTGGQVRNLLQGLTTTPTLGLVNTDKFFGSQTMRTVGNIGAGFEAAAGAVIGAGALGVGPAAGMFGASSSVVPETAAAIPISQSAVAEGPAMASGAFYSGGSAATSAGSILPSLSSTAQTLQLIDMAKRIALPGGGTAQVIPGGGGQMYVAGPGGQPMMMPYTVSPTGLVSPASYGGYGGGGGYAPGGGGGDVTSALEQAGVPPAIAQPVGDYLPWLLIGGGVLAVFLLTKKK